MLFDSTILIDFLNDVPGARAALSDAPQRSISIITWIEVLAGARTREAELAARELLSIFDLLPLTEEVAEIAVAIRRERRMKLPDAIIRATALHHGRVLVTRNTRDFPPGDPDITVPYRV